MWSGADGRIVAVSHADPPSRVAKMLEIGAVMEQALGLQPGWLFASAADAKAQQQMLIFVAGKRVRGACRSLPHASAGGGDASGYACVRQPGTNAAG